MKAVFGLAADENHVQKVINELIKNGFKNEEISLLWPDKGNKLQKEYPQLFSNNENMQRDYTENSREDMSRKNWDAKNSDIHQRQTENGRGEMTGENWESSDSDIHQKHKKHGQVSTEANTKAPEGGVTGATTGGILGGTLGLLAGLGALAIPGLGPFIAAGPLMAALGGSAIGGSLGLLVGSLVGYGIPEYEAKSYEAGLKGGKILVTAHANNEKQVTLAKDIMKRCGLTDISSSAEIATSSY